MHEPFAQKESNLKKKHKLPLTMASPSVPLHVDPPNWNQQRSHQLGGGSGGGDEAHNLPPLHQLGMADRARLANMAQPEQALKCPRCDSTNTKFCYFNNYSLSQPRHFCKACRRYWTRGGALRNVPVGGGCRRNKRHKSGSGARRSTAAKPATGAATNYQCIGEAGNSSAIASAAGYFHPLIHGNLGMRTLDSVGLENLGFQQHIQQFPKISGGVGPPPPLPPLPPPISNLFSSFGEGIGAEGPSFGAKMEAYGQDLSVERQYYLADPKYDLFWGGSS